MKTRDYFIDGELDRAIEAADTFCRDLAKAAAKQLRKFEPEVRDAVLCILQDATSLYSPYTADMIDNLLKETKR